MTRKTYLVTVHSHIARTPVEVALTDEEADTIRFVADLVKDAAPKENDPYLTIQERA